MDKRDCSGSFRTNKATTNGDWYLHVVSVNSNGLAPSPQIYGPFYSYSQIVKNIRLKTDRAQINNDGTSATISTIVPISNSIFPFSAINTTNIFYIKVLEGVCNISCSGTNNGLPFVRSNPSNISFKVSGSVINKVSLEVYWKADSTKSATVTLLISPPMDLDAQHPAVIYNNILNPDQGDKLEHLYHCATG